ncbi:MAG: M1 family metallopeptidase [Anaerolineales bacterium]
MTLAPAATVPSAPPARPEYTFYALLDYPGRQLAVDETIRYPNQTGVSLSEIVLAVDANLYANSFALETLFLDGNSAIYNLNGHRLTVFLPQPLAPGAVLTLAMRYHLAIPQKQSDYPHGYASAQVNLTEWYPFVAPYVDGWVLHAPWAFGEHLVYDSADFEVNLQVAGEGVVVAAPAPAQPNGEWTQYRLKGARTFVFSASDQYLMTESAVGSVVIRSYYFPWQSGAGEGMLRAAVQAVSLYAVKFAPYPYDMLNIVVTDVPDGQEFDGLVFVSAKFYAQYGGSAKSNLVSIGVHEIAHNWWFGLVGNDQALEPWLDEALCVYSERLFYEFNYPNYGDWWWDFRVNYFKPGGWVDTSIYDGGTFRLYTNAAYLNGAYFLEDLRVRMGERDFFAFLKDYAARYSYRRATAADFFATVRANTSADISDLIQAYFQGSY